MFKAKQAKDPVVLSYLALRKAVGFVALGLPFALAIPWYLASSGTIESSISGYYYTGMRNLLVGSLCAIAMFLLCCRGYDRQDEVAGVLASICALGVAFFPTAPDHGATPQQLKIGNLHCAFAGVLFLTLAYFCLVLFRMSAEGHRVTPRKRLRNHVYTVCGVVILASMLMIGLGSLLGLKYAVLGLDPTLCFETTSLLAFGLAWLTKGETFLKDYASWHPKARSGPG
jgi:hypothetical protein